MICGIILYHLIPILYCVLRFWFLRQRTKKVGMGFSDFLLKLAFDSDLAGLFSFGLFIVNLHVDDTYVYDTAFP
jgi:hypothetical protein